MLRKRYDDIKHLSRNGNVHLWSERFRLTLVPYKSLRSMCDRLSALYSTWYWPWKHMNCNICKYRSLEIPWATWNRLSNEYKSTTILYFYRVVWPLSCLSKARRWRGTVSLRKISWLYHALTFLKVASIVIFTDNRSSRIWLSHSWRRYFKAWWLSSSVS